MRLRRGAAARAPRASERGDRGVARHPPQRVDEDPDRTPGRADVLDLPAGDPVVDGPAAHVEEVACLPDRDGCPVGRRRFHRHTLHSESRPDPADRRAPAR